MNLNKLFEVYEFAKSAHESIDQKRKTGEPYITHPIEVANLAFSYGSDEQTIHACLLHDVVEDTPIKLEEITRRFGQETSFLVDGVTKLETPEKTLEKIKEYSNENSRVILIKLLDRLHNTDNLNGLDYIKKKYKISNPWYIELARKHNLIELSDKLEQLTQAL